MINQQMDLLIQMTLKCDFKTSYSVGLQKFRNYCRKQFLSFWNTVISILMLAQNFPTSKAFTMHFNVCAISLYVFFDICRAATWMEIHERWRKVEDSHVCIVADNRLLDQIRLGKIPDLYTEQHQWCVSDFSSLKQ